MKIGIDARFWNESGVGRYVRNLIKELLTLDRKNEYVLFVQKKDYEQIRTSIGNWKLEIGNWKFISTDIHWHSLREQLLFPRVLLRENLDLMHFPYFSIPIFYNQPFIVTIHDLILHHFATGSATTKSPVVYQAKLSAYKLIIKRAAQKARKIIAVSQSTKDEIIDHLGIQPDKISVIYEGVNLGSKQDKPQVVPDKYFLHVGNIYPHKNLNRLLLAFKKLTAKTQQPVNLVIVGKKDYFHLRFGKYVKELDLENKVFYSGELADAQLAYLYGHALALVSPSVMEGFDLPVVEAMAVNCLVVVSDIPVHREICRQAGLYFAPDSTEELADLLFAVYNNGKDHYKEKITLGKEISSQFSWKKMASDTLKIYANSLSV